MLFTAYPICAFAILEKDVFPGGYDSHKLKSYIPFLYFAGQRNLSFNQFQFGLWCINAIMQAVLIFQLCKSSFEQGIISS